MRGYKRAYVRARVRPCARVRLRHAAWTRTVGAGQTLDDGGHDAPGGSCDGRRGASVTRRAAHLPWNSEESRLILGIQGLKSGLQHVHVFVCVCV